MICILAAGALILAAPDPWLPTSRDVTPLDVRWTLTWFVANTIVTLIANILQGPFRAQGKFALGVFVSETARLLEVIALLCLALLGAKIATAAMGCFIVRAAGVAFGFVLLPKHVPWVRLGFADAAPSEIKRLARHAAAIMVLPLSFSFLLQGMTLVVGATLGYAAVAVFVATRTISRVAVQLVGLLMHPLLPEISSAVGRRDRARLSKLMVLVTVWVLGTVPLCFWGISLFGTELVHLWTSGRIEPRQDFVVLMAASAAVHISWLAMTAFLVAANRTETFSYWFLASSGACVGAGYWLSHFMGLNGVGAALLLADIAMFVLVAKKTRLVLSGISEEPAVPGSKPAANAV